MTLVQLCLPAWLFAFGSPGRVVHDWLSTRFLARVSDDARGRLPCTGTNLASGGVITALHCVGDGPAFVLRSGERVLLRMPLVDSREPDDVAIVQLPHDIAPAEHALELASAADFESLSTRELWVAAFSRGITRAYLVDANARYVTVIAPQAVLCYGDSGAPLLVWSGDQWKILGTLDIGDRDCRAAGENRFVRSDHAPTLPR
ncbi:MAG: hypothetical protein JWN04_168 [Myxococcaceae bacterium]|nr:hypothetical protein [Myxococcaceae bacterium]